MHVGQGSQKLGYPCHPSWIKWKADPCFLLHTCCPKLTISINCYIVEWIIWTKAETLKIGMCIERCIAYQFWQTRLKPGCYQLEVLEIKRLQRENLRHRWCHWELLLFHCCHMSWRLRTCNLRRYDNSPQRNLLHQRGDRRISSVLRLISQQAGDAMDRITYNSNFSVVIVGEIKTFAICWSN